MGKFSVIRWSSWRTITTFTSNSERQIWKKYMCCLSFSEHCVYFDCVCLGIWLKENSCSAYNQSETRRFFFQSIRSGWRDFSRPWQQLLIFSLVDWLIVVFAANNGSLTYNSTTILRPVHVVPTFFLQFSIFYKSTRINLLRSGRHARRRRVCARASSRSCAPLHTVPPVCFYITTHKAATQATSSTTNLFWSWQ